MQHKKISFTDSKTLFHKLGLLRVKNGVIVSEIRRGFSVSIIDKLCKELNITEKELIKYIAISPSALVRRRKAKRLNVNESNRIFRIVETYRNVLIFFDDNVDATRQWLNKPSKFLNGETPLEYLDTEAGFCLIQNLLGRLEHGVIT